MALEIVRYTWEGVKAHPRRTIGLAVAASMLGLAGYLTLKNQSTRTPDLSPQNPVPTSPFGVSTSSPTEILVQNQPTPAATPAFVSTEELNNGRYVQIGTRTFFITENHCDLWINGSYVKTYNSGDTTEYQKAKCIGRGRGDVFVWQLSDGEGIGLVP